MHLLLWCGLLGAAISTLVRLCSLKPRAMPAKKPPRKRSDRCSLAVFLGSGGHTSEALMLISALDFGRYSPRTYIISHGDVLSTQKAVDLESDKAADSASYTRTLSDKPYTFVTIPRARRVHQSLLTAPITTAISLAVSVYHISLIPLIYGPPFADVLILNGPGTCFVLCVATYLNRFLGMPSPELIYIESFARVKSLSLSGRILRPLVDRFVVQWPDLLRDGKRGECRGWLV